MNKKKNDNKSGKKLENLIKIIQETLKDSPNTVIHSNYKIPNSGGRKREIDVLIESNINGISIKIAIECKDYAKAVSVDKIEAFKGKCDRIVDINKKVFVSKNGYQADAIKAAKEFGIDLYEVKDIDTTTIKNWLPPIIMLGFRYSLTDKPTIIIDEEAIIQPPKVSDFSFYFSNGEPSIDIESFMNKMLFKERQKMFGITLHYFLNRDCKNPQQKINLPFDIKLDGIYMLAENGLKIPIIGISSSVEAWLVDNEVLPEETNALVDLKGEIKTNNITIPLGEKEKAHWIFTQNKRSIFYTNESGVSQELKLLATYPKKNND